MCYSCSTLLKSLKNAASADTDSYSFRKSNTTRSSKGQPVSGSTRKRTPVTGHSLPTSESRSITMDHQLTYTYPAGADEQTGVESSNERVSYQSSAQIQAWAVDLGGLADHQTLDIHSGVSLPSDDVWSNGAPQIPGFLSHSNSSDGSENWNSVPMQRGSGSMLSSQATGITNLSQSEHAADYPVSQDLRFDLPTGQNGGHCAMDFSYSLDNGPYPSPVENDVTFPIHPMEQTFLPEDVHSAFDSCQELFSSSNGRDVRTGPLDDTYSNRWHDASEDPSISSSLSSHIPDTPLSQPFDHWDDTCVGTQSSLVSGSNQLPSPTIPFSEAQSTVRTTQGSQRNPLPDQWMPPPPEIAGQVYGSPVSTFASSRRSSEGEPSFARRHPLYQIQPRDDGFYQCVYAEDGKLCDHEPFRLKCNYDKHLDSHLKPYRCKQRGCAENPFSSTACLLRHEREAHKMHNHKEVLCLIKDCDRSVPGKGFPRKWNAHDHMKRVHHYTPAEDSNGCEPPSPSASSPDLPSYPEPINARTTKRRIPSTPECTGARKSKTTTSAKSSRGVGRSQVSQQQFNGGRGFSEQDVLAERRCSDWTAWHQGQTFADPELIFSQARC